jgi:GNAT superfamily N-acetyltransferase
MITEQIIYKSGLPPVGQFFELFESTGWNEEYNLTLEELTSSVKNSFYCVSAFDGDKLVGFGRLVTDGILHAMIYEMIVSPPYQKRNIGSQILKMLLNKCFELNIRDIELFCAKGKRSFYEKHGFAARPDDGPGMEYRGTRNII